MIKAEVAEGTFKKALGLMFRTNLPDNQGMIFVFPKDGYHSFWMMFTRIPLDILWVSSNKEIVHIEKNIQPRWINFKSYKPKEKARFVIEVAGNWTDKHGVKVGEKVHSFDYPE